VIDDDQPVGPPPLRRYQLEPLAAILRAAEAHDADILTVRMSRQAGKNELSARVEGVLFGHELQVGGSGQGAAGTAAKATRIEAIGTSLSSQH